MPTLEDDTLVFRFPEIDRDVRQAIRSRAIEVNHNSNYNVINGLPRLVPQVPEHERYNPPGFQPVLDLAG